MLKAAATPAMDREPYIPPLPQSAEAKAANQGSLKPTMERRRFESFHRLALDGRVPTSALLSPRGSVDDKSPTQPRLSPAPSVDGKPPTPPRLSPAPSMEGKPPTPPRLSPNGSIEANPVSMEAHPGQVWPGMGAAAGSRAMGRSGSGTRFVMRTPSPRPASGPGVEMEPLVEALAGDDPDKVREAAVTIRSSLKNNPGNKARLLAAGGIDLLIEKLASPDPTTVEHCVTALLNMSLTEGVEPLITSAGGIEGIVHVLKTGSAVARENAAAALFTLSGPMENKLKVRDAQGIRPLVDLLRTGRLRGRKDAALALFNLTLEAQCIPQIVEEGTVHVLVGLLTGSIGGAGGVPDPGMEDKVMAVIANLCKFAKGREAVHTEGGIAAMVDVIDGGSARAQEDAAVSLHLMAVNNEASFQLILEEGAMPGLVKLGQSGTSRAKAKAKALLELLRGHASQNSGSFQFSEAYSQSFARRAPATGELKDRLLTGELR